MAEYKHPVVKGLSLLIHHAEDNVKDPIGKLVMKGIRGQIPKLLRAIDSSEHLVEEIRSIVLPYLEPEKPILTPEELEELRTKVEEEDELDFPEIPDGEVIGIEEVEEEEPANILELPQTLATMEFNKIMPEDLKQEAEEPEKFEEPDDMPLPEDEVEEEEE